MSTLPVSRTFRSAVSIVALIAAAVGVVSISRWSANRGTVTAAPVTTALAAPAPNVQQSSRVRANLGVLPLAFEANQGQADARVKYIARGNKYTMFLTATDAVFAMRSASASQNALAKGPGVAAALRAEQTDQAAAISIHPIGGNSRAQIAAGDQLPGHSNYFLGNDPSRWHTNVAQYARVSYRDVYPGVNLAFYGVERQLEFDFIVAPGASTAPIRLGVSGARRISTDDSGNLVLSSAAGDVVLHKPVAYQQKNGNRESVDARFVLQARNQVAFELGAYDRSRELVIDPSVSYATYLGGSLEDDGNAIAIDSSGNAYVTGQTMSANFPKVGGVGANTNSGGFDAFVTKISPNGSTLIYSTYVGGGLDDSGNAIAVDASGDAFVAGGTKSLDFPTTLGAFQTNQRGTVNAFVFKLNAAGNGLTYSTYLGGTGSDVANGIALTKDGSGDTFIVGSTSSTDFPLTVGAFQLGFAGTPPATNGFVTQLNSTGTPPLVYSTYLGAGAGGDVADAVAASSAGNAYVTGLTPNFNFPTTSGAFQTVCGTGSGCNGGLPDAFVSVINPTLSGPTSLAYSTFLGGEGKDEGLGIALDASNNAYVTGLTQSLQFPLKSAAQSTFGGGGQDAFVAELNSTLNTLVYSTYLGGSGSEGGTGIALDGSNNAYVTGQTDSQNFPTVNPTQGTIGGANDAFVTEINSSGSPFLFSTYLGGTLDENTRAGGGNLAVLGSIAVNSTGANIYVAGNTVSANFPTKSPYQPNYGGGNFDAFVAMYTQAAAAPNFAMTASALSPASVSQGGSATSTVTITSIDGYAGTVNFTCSVVSVSGGNPLPTCPTLKSVTNGAGSSTLTVDTTGAAAMYRRSRGIFYAAWLPIVGLSWMGMRFSGAGTPKKKLLGLLLLGLILTLLFFLPACGGGSSNNGGGGGGCTGCTPTGNYKVTVTGTDSSNKNLTSTATLTLTVN